MRLWRLAHAAAAALVTTAQVSWCPDQLACTSTITGELGFLLLMFSFMTIQHMSILYADLTDEEKKKAQEKP
ncbi:hypothetical protein KY289_008533 [Solanum tuberosum]|nr:hypothetical protein KY289_008533 [Solanum tuberosum]